MVILPLSGRDAHSGWIRIKGPRQGFIVGIFWTVGGVAQVLYGFSAKEGEVSWPIVILGCIAMVVGILCLVYPSLSLSIMCVIIGLGMIVYGIVEIVVSLHARTLKKI